MKFVVAQAKAQPNGYFSCWAEQFSTLEKARKYMGKLERMYLPAGKSLDGFVIASETHEYPQASLWGCGSLRNPS